MSIVKKDRPSILGLSVAPVQPKAKAKPKPRKKPTFPPASPCMPSRLATNAIEQEMLRTAQGRATVYLMRYYHDLKMPSDW